MKQTSLTLSLLLILFAGGLWAESLDGIYLCEAETYLDGSVGESSLIKINGKILKDQSKDSEKTYERIYEYKDNKLVFPGVYDSSFKLFFSSTGEVIMANKIKNKRDINVSAIEPRKSQKKNLFWYKHCEKLSN
tara:strand:+ start:170 stop:571 length:402 start_codon:yes stop_codon:yes gene_type:complete